jgi:DNA-binding transcriptional regulator YdaS (Cro superfamily)
MDNMIELLKKALPGSQKATGKLINVSQPAIHKWITGKSKPSAKNAIAIERATHGAITREQLRPDVFGPAPDTEARP